MHLHVHSTRFYSNLYKNYLDEIVKLHLRAGYRYLSLILNAQRNQVNYCQLFRSKNNSLLEKFRIQNL